MVNRTFSYKQCLSSGAFASVCRVGVIRGDLSFSLANPYMSSNSCGRKGTNTTPCKKVHSELYSGVSYWSISCHKVEHLR